MNTNTPDTQNKDIFDRIMSWKIFSWAWPFYKKYKEILLYLFFGVITMLISIGTFTLFNVSFHMDEHLANILSWIIAVFVAFVTNRKWVFTDTDQSETTYFAQMLKFYGGRLATLGAEELIIYIFITLLHFNSVAVKIAAQVVVIVLNYIISKLFIFVKKK